MRRSRSGGRRQCRRDAPAAPGHDDRVAGRLRHRSRAIDEVRPDPRDADELHDALLTAGFLLEAEANRICAPRSSASAAPPAARRWTGTRVWVGRRATSRIAGRPSRAVLEPPIAAASVARSASVDEGGSDRGAVFAVACRSSGRRPRRRLRTVVGVAPADIDAALLDLESEGVVLRGVFTPARMRSSGAIAAARPDPSLHAESPARRNLAGDAGGVHAVPVRVAARGAIEPARRARGPAGGARAARWRGAAGARLGARRAAGADRTVRAGDARHAVPERAKSAGRGCRAARRRWSARRRSHCFSASTPTTGGRCGRRRPRSR